MSAILKVSGLSKRFGGLQAVGDVSFEVPQGAIKAVIGPNGAGKSTLFNLIAGSTTADSGAVSFNRQSIYGMSPHQVASRGLARTFQHTKLFAKMTALENVMVGRHTRGKSGFISGMLGLPWSRAEDREFRDRSLEVMEFMGIEALAGLEATSLAFGQQRWVELARALVSEPALLLLDEPAAGLNMHETSELAVFIKRIRQERGITVLLVEHDMSLVMKISDEVVVLSSGRKIADDTTFNVQVNAEVIRVYLGGDEEEETDAKN